MPVLAVAATGCGSTTAKGDRQDKDEPEGNFPVAVEEAEFPLRQKLAQTAKMKIVVRNAGTEEIPNIAVTVQCEAREITVTKTSGETAITAPAGTFDPGGDVGRTITGSGIPTNATLEAVASDTAATLSEDATESGTGDATLVAGKNGQDGSFDRQIAAQASADKNRPNFVVDQIPIAVGDGAGNLVPTGRPASRQDLDPLERSSAYVNTYTLGELPANRTATFEWKVTAVRAGQFRLCYRVAAGLDGKAKAVPAQGSLPIKQEWNGNISDVAPRTGVADDGETITTLPEQPVPAP